MFLRIKQNLLNYEGEVEFRSVCYAEVGGYHLTFATSSRFRCAVDQLTSLAMVKFAVTPSISTILQEYNIQKTLSEDHEGYIDPSAPSIDHVFLSNILTFLQSHNPSCAKNYSFHEVLKSTSLYIEPPPPRKPVPPIYLWIV